MNHPTADTKIEYADMLIQEEAAIKLGVATRTLKRWRLAGRGPRYYQYGPKTIRYRISDIDQWLDDHEGDGE